MQPSFKQITMFRAIDELVIPRTYHQKPFVQAAEALIPVSRLTFGGLELLSTLFLLEGKFNLSDISIHECACDRMVTISQWSRMVVILDSH